jgi:hypothetical protein
MPKLTSEFSNHPDYIESRSNPWAVYFGMIGPKYSKVLGRDILPEETLQKFHNDINWRRESSEYIGRVFYPERRIPNYKYNYEDNKAFWAGVIDSGKTLVLVTDIMHYTFPTGTVDELLWLKDSGYIFEPDPNSENYLQTIARPNPALFQLGKEIKDYRNGKGRDGNKKEMLARLDKIKDAVREQRKELQQGVRPGW